MSKFRPTLEALERREVFSTFGVYGGEPAAMAAPAAESFSLNFTKIEYNVATGDVNGDGAADVLASRSVSFAGDGFGLNNLLPYMEQDNLYKLTSSAIAADLPSADVDRQQIIAILIGLVRSSDGAGDAQNLTDITDGTSNTLSVTHDADFEKWASAFSSLPTEDRQQIIAILIGLAQSPPRTADASVTDLVMDPFNANVRDRILASDEYFSRFASQTQAHVDGLLL